jgi:teichoic acid transport system ATP-binding protein
VDEALAVGDTAFQAKCFNKFKEFQKKGITILFVTHSLDLITKYCSYAYLLEAGKLQFEGDPKSTIDEYNRLMVNLSTKEDSSDHLGIEKSSIKRGVEWAGDFNINPNENRYGNAKAQIIEGGIFTDDGRPVQTLNHGQFYEFHLKVKFNEKLQEPILAYTIKDVKGFDISGSNTLYQKIETGTMQKGDVIIAVFKQKMLLNPGGYLLSFGCTGNENEDFVVYDRRYDYLTFDVVSNRNSVGFFDLESKIEVMKL